jgi:hypothetical protein
MDVPGGSLAELMDDPLIGLVMKSDGVDRRELELLLERAARRECWRPDLQNAGKPSRQQTGSGPRSVLKKDSATHF